MKREMSSMELALYLAKKFGFISRSVAWDFLTPKGRTARYAHWRKFQDSPFFAPYMSGGGVQEYLVLSAKGKEFLGTDVVTGVDDVFFTHDEIVMRFCLALHSEPSVCKLWSEGELKKDRALAMKELGDASVSKLPDLLFDVGDAEGFLRCALEIERTRKSRVRYQTIQRAFQRAENVDVILFGVNDGGIEECLREVFNDSGFESLGKDIAFFCIQEFLENQFGAPLRSGNCVSTLGEYFRGAGAKNPLAADFTRHGVRGGLREVVIGS